MHTPPTTPNTAVGPVVSKAPEENNRWMGYPVR